MKWITKSYLLPNECKNLTTLLDLITRSTKSIDFWIDKTLGYSVYYKTQKHEEETELIGELLDQTIQWQVYLEIALTDLMGPQLDFRKKEYSTPMASDGLHYAISHYREERGELLHLISCVDEEFITAKIIYVESLDQRISISGLLFLIYLHNDLSARTFELLNRSRDIVGLRDRVA